MRRLLLATAVFALSLTPSFAQEVKKNDMIPSVEGMWLNVQNAESLSTLFYKWTQNEVCMTKIGGTITVAGITDDGRVLVLYRNEQFSGTIVRCPNGTAAFISTERWFAAMDEGRQQTIKQEEAKKDKDLARELLKQFNK
ncbi:MAG: hypothetical protein UY70_C0003G0020 [Candidatus Kaiserbacteria bacterium GW2011_GWB1_52_6]|uniref:Uncharacterized protein n=3 Tax=Candidatus Kaiseribacteriota TaxID=1752734 RepID=A0A0G2AH95_9BACT|nr:MAG: hypothetical protein UY67_C0005G0032 [Candidatus Kaiserbacteria bacterium GW2011_GWA2_52_12]KKW28097.1 MAG: hypothetical protein UY70_C0003G0020 [Candidatus Kaiserbacteria bacterium GW2011_GWB1_52_6]KKW31934.1 MAG: hypothetical protein UY74_C0003G0007 [Candidatus Kaiserbacteria bacterium GW2011_GWC2_52_8b]